MYACKAGSPAGVSALFADQLHGDQLISLRINAIAAAYSRNSLIDDALPPVAFSAYKRDKRLYSLPVVG